MSQYAVLSLKNVPSESYELICSRLFDDGAEGVSESLKFIQESQQYDPEIIPEENKNIEAYFLPENTDLESLKLSYAAFHPELLVEENKDWMSEWKKHYKPFKVVGDLWIYPSWVESDKAHKKIIKIDPGLAFGTGTHATTLLCMRKIEELFSLDSVSFKQASVLDVGAGTGILSVLCSLNGFKEIIAVEIDEMAREKCRENFEINKVKASVLSDKEADYSKKYDLVVANIIDGVLLTLKNQLLSAAKKDVILSGILRENEEAVVESFSEEGFKLISKAYLEEWCLLHLKKA